MLTVFGLLGLEAYGQTGSDTARKLDLLKAYPDVIVYNGKIATMDDKMTTVQAMAVRGRRILLLGTNDEIRSLAGPKTELIDAKGRMVLPGLIDSHTHPHLWGIEHFAHEYDPQFKITYLTGTGPEVSRALESAISKRAAELGPGKWIIVHVPQRLVWGPNLMTNTSIMSALFSPHRDVLQGENLVITRAELDAMAPNNPVFLASGLWGITNTKGREVFLKSPKIANDLVGLRIWYCLPKRISSNNTIRAC